MTFAVVYSEPAVHDIAAAVEWLVLRAPAAVPDLMKALERVEGHLTRNPGIYQIVRNAPSGDIRRVNLRPFRYQLYFQIVGTEVVMIACLHASRSPVAHATITRSRI